MEIQDKNNRSDKTDCVCIFLKITIDLKVATNCCNEVVLQSKVLYNKDELLVLGDKCFCGFSNSWCSCDCSQFWTDYSGQCQKDKLCLI